MYSKKFQFEKIEQSGWYNPVYEDMEGRVCYPAYLKVGERGWVLYERDDDSLFAWPHRLHTSIIKDVKYTRDGRIVITTEHTRLVLEVIRE